MSKDRVNVILCAECGLRGAYKVDTIETMSSTVSVVSTTATCELCGHLVNLARDIEPNLEAGDRLTITDDGFLAYVTADPNPYKVRQVDEASWEVVDSRGGYTFDVYATREAAELDAQEMNRGE